MRHLASSLRVGSKAAATAVAATLVVGGVAVAQTGSAAPDDEVIAGDGSDEDGSDADGSDDGDADGSAEDGSDADGSSDGGEGASTDPEDEDDPDRSVDDGAGGDEDGEGDDGAGDDDLDAEPTGDGGESTGDGGESTPVDGDDGGGRGSATSERVHEAQTLDGQLRPGDEGWGAAVSESARSGGHGERVSRAARGLDAAPPAEPGTDAAASSTRKEPPGRSPRAGGQAPGQGGSKDRGGR